MKQKNCRFCAERRTPLFHSIAPTGLLDAPEFGLNVCPLVKRQPAAQAPRFPRRAIRELRVGMEAWHRRIGPGSMARVPGSDNPASAVGGTASGVRAGKNFVVVRLPLEALCAFEHNAILHAQIAQCFLGAVGEPKLHADGMGRGDDFGSKDDSVGQLSLDSERAVRAAVPFQSFEFDLLSSPD